MQNKTKDLIVVHGATAVGKTATAILLAQQLGCDIINCDSRQFYRQMRIGTAVPSPEELALVTHHFIHDRSVDEPISSGGYESEAMELLSKLFTTGDCAIVAGGSGLYAAALTDGLDSLPKDDSLREELHQIALEELQEELQLLDPIYYTQIDICNRRRVERAVEVCRLTGKPYSALRTNSKKERPFNIIEIALEREREELYQRIDLRVDMMIRQGLIEEARSLIDYRALSALQTVGYRELFDHFDGKTSLDEAITLIKRNSRRYAKRQMTWLRSREQIRYFAPSELDEILSYIYTKN
ncbi:MAG: tRNA (adenosine(37)-N6)-dimethylallyltransferase MiaA [Rikenellaceae bacterium]